MGSGQHAFFATSLLYVRAAALRLSARFFGERAAKYCFSAQAPEVPQHVQCSGTASTSLQRRAWLRQHAKCQRAENTRIPFRSTRLKASAPEVPQHVTISLKDREHFFAMTRVATAFCQHAQCQPDERSQFQFTRHASKPQSRKSLNMFSVATSLKGPRLLCSETMRVATTFCQHAERQRERTANSLRWTCFKATAPEVPQHVQ